MVRTQSIIIITELNKGRPYKLLYQTKLEDKNKSSHNLKFKHTLSASGL